MTDQYTDGMYQEPREPDDKICELLVTTTENVGRDKPWNIVSKVAETFDYEETRYALKTLMLDGIIKIDSSGDCYVNEDIDQ